jgi:hypothetical protein
MFVGQLKVDSLILCERDWLSSLNLIYEAVILIEGDEEMNGLNCLCALSIGLLLWQQPEPIQAPTVPAVNQVSARRAEFLGLAEDNDRDCPVAISDVVCEVDFDSARERPLHVIREELKIENRSNKAITKVFVGIEMDLGPGWAKVGSSMEVAGLIRPGESRTEVRRRLTEYGRGRQPWNGEVPYVAFVIGVEYEDGSHWAASRTYKRPLFGRFFQDFEAPIRGVTAEWPPNGSYKTKLEMTREDVVGYRLGLVKDTPEEYEVKLGRFVELAKPFPKKGEKVVISDNDERVSFTSEELFPPELYRGREQFVWDGVMLFVAEVRFANGDVWKKSQKREDLLWNVR